MISHSQAPTNTMYSAVRENIASLQATINFHGYSAIHEDLQLLSQPQPNLAKNFGDNFFGKIFLPNFYFGKIIFVQTFFLAKSILAKILL